MSSTVPVRDFPPKSFVRSPGKAVLGFGLIMGVASLPWSKWPHWMPTQKVRRTQAEYELQKLRLQPPENA